MKAQFTILHSTDSTMARETEWQLASSHAISVHLLCCVWIELQFFIWYHWHQSGERKKEVNLPNLANIVYEASNLGPQ